MPEVVVVTISGPAGSGKSTIGKKLAQKLNVKYHSAGDFFRQKAREAGEDIKEFMKDAPEDLHLQADSYMDELSKKGNVVLDGRLSGYMASGADYRIYLTAPVEVRAGRIAGREGLELEEAKMRLVNRDEQDVQNYREIYGINLNDLSVYDLSLNTEHYGINEVLAVVEKSVRLALKL